MSKYGLIITYPDMDNPGDGAVEFKATGPTQGNKRLIHSLRLLADAFEGKLTCDVKPGDGQ